MTQPIVGGVSQKSFTTGLEDFDIPFDFGDSGSGSSGSVGGSGSATNAPPSFPEYEESSEASSGGFGGTELQKMQMLLQMDKTRDDFGRLVKQAKFFLPRTLEQISGQYGTQGSYWSSGRREAQQDAAKKTQFDLGQAKADAEFELKNMWLQLAQMQQSEQGSRSA